MHLFRIIQDVDAYAEFLPLCSHSKILKISNGGRTFEATLTVGLPWGPGILKETYVSHVEVHPETMTIETTSIQSQLFDNLKSTWKLEELMLNEEESHCKIDFEVEMTVTDPMAASVLDKILKKVAERQVEAFDKRCQEIILPADIQAAIATNASGKHQERKQ